MGSDRHVDIAIVGAGILGLAHALAAAKQNLRVAVFERNFPVMGASIRNFGMVWPIGQPDGALLNRALRSREVWLEVAARTGFGIELSGSLHLAYRDDELAVLEDFVAIAAASARPVQLLTAEQAIEKSPAVNPTRLLGALWSPTEAIVDPREAIRRIPAFLTAHYGVTFYVGATVTEIAYPTLTANRERWTADHIVVCSGTDFETLYPDLFEASGITRVKLQMLRTCPQPNGWRIGPSLAAGLTLTHYSAFADCPSLPALKARIAAETPHLPRWGIHVMVSQNAAGELTIGDSHEYGLSPEPFDQIWVNDQILEYFKGFARVPDLAIAQTWHGIYAKLPGKSEWVTQPEPGVTLVNAPGGAGMTLSFGLAEEVIATILRQKLNVSFSAN